MDLDACSLGRLWRRPCGRRGFSLIEVVVTLVVMATVATVAIGRYGRSIDRYRTEAAARRVEVEFARAVSHARSTSAPVAISFDVGTEVMDIPALPSLKNPADPAAIDLAGEPYHAEIVSVDFEGFPELTIDGFGVANRHGSVTVASGEMQVVVSFDRTTGEATPGPTVTRP